MVSGGPERAGSSPGANDPVFPDRESLRSAWGVHQRTWCSCVHLLILSHLHMSTRPCTHTYVLGHETHQTGSLNATIPQRQGSHICLVPLPESFPPLPKQRLLGCLKAQNFSRYGPLYISQSIRPFEQKRPERPTHRGEYWNSDVLTLWFENLSVPHLQLLDNQNTSYSTDSTPNSTYNLLEPVSLKTYSPQAMSTQPQIQVVQKKKENYFCGF